jgi:hypothetical protein
MFAHSGMVNSLHLKICPICILHIYRHLMVSKDPSSISMLYLKVSRALNYVDKLSDLMLWHMWQNGALSHLKHCFTLERHIFPFLALCNISG